MTFSDQRTVYRDQEVKTQPSHKPVGTFPVQWPIVHADLRTTRWIPLPLCPSQGFLPWSESEVLATAPALPLPSLFLSDSLSFPVSSSHLLPALPFSHPPPPNTAAVWLPLYIAVITIKVLKGDNPSEEARLTPSSLLSLAWCNPAPPFP